MHWFRYVSIFITSIFATLLIVFGLAAYSSLDQSKRGYLWLLGIPATILYVFCFMCIGYGNWYDEFEWVERVRSWFSVCCSRTCCCCCCCTDVESADKHEEGVFTVGGSFPPWTPEGASRSYVRKSNAVHYAPKKRFITDYFGIRKPNSSVYKKMRENIPRSPVGVHVSSNSSIKSKVKHHFRGNRFTVIPVEEHRVDVPSEAGEASLHSSDEIRQDLSPDAELWTLVQADQLKKVIQLIQERSANTDESERKSSWHETYRKVLLAAKRSMGGSLQGSRSADHICDTDEEALTEVDSAELNATPNNILENSVVNRAKELQRVCSTAVASGGEKVLSSIKKNKHFRFTLFNKSNYQAMEEEKGKRVKPKPRKVTYGDGLEYAVDFGFDDGGFCGDCGDCGCD